MVNKNCSCPYVICKIHGNCMACIEKSRNDSEMVNCMEEIAEKLGAKIPLRLPKTVVCEDYESVSLFNAEQIAEVVNRKPDALICVPGDATAIRTYEILVEMKNQNKVSFRQAQFVSLYEWIGDNNKSENFSDILQKNLYDPLNIKNEQIISFVPISDNVVDLCKRTDEAISHMGGIDIILMNTGPIGELGFNLPGEDFDCYTKVVNVKYKEEEFSVQGVTIGVRHMFEAKKVILYACNKDKEKIISEVYRSRPTNQLPATVIKLLPGGMVVMDKDAASLVRDIL